jgi:hypothetical protein
VLPPRQLGVKGPEDLWGGYVEHDFICTKPSVTVCATI